MRTIKFRAWTGKEMKVNGFNVGFDGVPFHYQQYEGSVSRPEWVLMQFTGLQDKNGKDIYEGDAVKITWSGRICQVVFHKYTAGFDLDYISDPLPGIIHPGLGPEKWKDHVEVIGNIYENPELLK